MNGVNNGRPRIPSDVKRRATGDPTHLFLNRQKISGNSSGSFIESNMLKRELLVIAAIEDVKDTPDEPIVLLQKLIEVFGGGASSHTFGDLLLSLSELSDGDIKQIKDFIAEEVTVDTSLLPLDNFLENDKPEHDTHCTISTSKGRNSSRN
jgi:hypothetical protein